MPPEILDHFVSIHLFQSIRSYLPRKSCSDTVVIIAVANSGLAELNAPQQWLKDVYTNPLHLGVRGGTMDEHLRRRAQYEFVYDLTDDTLSLRVNSPTSRKNLDRVRARREYSVRRLGRRIRDRGIGIRKRDSIAVDAAREMLVDKEAQLLWQVEKPKGLWFRRLRRHV